MAQTHAPHPEARVGALANSIQRHQRAALTHRSQRGWRMFKGALAAGSAEANSVTVELLPDGPHGGPTGIEPGETVGVTFRSGHKKCMFSAQVLSRTKDGETDLLTLSWPTALKQLQRRAFERETIPRSEVIPVRFWPDNEAEQDERSPRNVHHGQLENLSAGGMSVKASELLELEQGTVYRCVFAPSQGAQALVVHAKLRHHEAIDRGRASLGFQFIGLEMTSEGRRAVSRIARIVATYQKRRQSRRRPK